MLIITIGVIVALTGLVLVFARQMRVESLASGNLLSALQADAVVTGAAQHVLNRLANTQDKTQLDSEVRAQAVPLGDGQFWIIRPNPEDERQYAYGIADEAGKLNINTASADMLLRLPGMTPELAGAIVDWRDEDEVLSDGGGAESEYYLLQSPPHYCKNAPFETLDELLLLKGATSEILFGVDANRNGVVDADEAGAQTTLSGFNGQAQCGICKYLTAYSLEANTSRTGQPRVFVGDTSTQTLTALLVMLSQTLSAERVAAITTKLRQTPRPPANVLDFYVKSGMTIEEFKPVADQLTTDRTRLLTGRVNVNTAPREVLRCLPGMEDGDIDLLLARRANGGGGGTELENIAWVAETLPPAKAALIGGSITTRSFQYSADIVGVSGNGRGFKRFKYVFDIRNTPARTLLRKDLSHTGWPLSAELRGSTGLRAGGETSRGFSLETR